MTFRIGILGAARVATYAVIAAAKDVDGVDVAGVASRDLAKAKAYADEHNIPRAFAGYQAIIDDPDIDAIYVALPPAYHAKWSIAAAEAGKPVLCEKPFTLDPAEVEAIIAAEARTGKLIMEAQHSHYHPLAARMREILRTGILGNIHTAKAVFNAPLVNTPGEHRFIEEMGGGALWDLGVYPAYWIRSALNEEPAVISAAQKYHSGGADISTQAALKTPSGVIAELYCDMQSEAVEASFEVTGDRGSLYVENPVSPQSGHDLMLIVDGLESHEQYGSRPSFSYQLEAFRDAVITGGDVPTRGYDSLATINLLHAIRVKAKGI